MKNKLQFDTARLEQLVNAGRTTLQKASKQARGYVGHLTGVTIMPRRRIEVKQLGLATGVVIHVRRVRRVHIPVKYIESN